jgi:curved DNA-binding protein
LNDPYSILGVESSATSAELKTAYKKLAMKYHPDRNDGKDDKFKEVKEAYDKVKDGNFGKRPLFDFNFDTGSDIHDFIRKARERQQQKISLTVSISLKDAVNGKEQLMQLPIFGQQESALIKIPPGTMDGETILYRKLALGVDVQIKYKVLPDPVWSVENLDLIKRQPVSIWLLIAGGELDVSTIDGRTMRLKIPQGTNPGTQMRVKGNGVVSRLNKITQGDMLVQLDGKIPKDIDPVLLNMIKEASG